LKLLLCYWSGDLIGAEQHFLAGLEFFDDPLFRQQPIVSAVNAFGYGALNALALGQADIARERLARMMAAVDQNNPSHQVKLVFLPAWFHLNMREYERAEALAARAVELSEQHPFTNYADVARFFLGAARAHLGRATEGMALLREGMAGMLRLGYACPTALFSFTWWRRRTAKEIPSPP